jgi:hypothetical protein
MRSQTFIMFYHLHSQAATPDSMRADVQKPLHLQHIRRQLADSLSTT